MKKTFITFLSALLLMVTGLKAQSIKEGMDHLYADRFKTAAGIFQKLLAENPNNIEAIYWLGQTYFDMDDDDKAKEVYEKALQTNGRAPLILVGLGHADLLNKKVNDARQKFEEALTASKDRKGNNDPVVATAIGRANVDAKAGNYQWAVQLLEEAANSYKKNPPTETLLQLGNAYRKAGEGKGGGKAFETYKKALEVDPNFAVADLRLAKLFESQKNWDFVLEYLNDALKRDPKFTPAYYELFYYYFFTKKYDEAEAQLKKYIDSKLPETDINDDSYYAQLCWARQDYDCAIQKDEKVVAQLGDKAKPRVFKLLADAYYQKGDYTNAQKYIDWYFRREKPEDYISFDYKLKADILSKSGATDEEVFSNYVTGVKVDTVLADKIDFLKQGAKFFKDNKKRGYEAQLIQMIIDLKPNPTINDYFDLTIANYFAPDYFKSRDAALQMQEKFPDQVYGYEWAYNNAVAITTDTTLSDSLRTKYNNEIGAPDAMKLYEFSQKDTVKFKSQYINAVKFLAAYYINVAKDKEKSLEFFKKWQSIDTANAEAIQGYIDQIQKMPGRPSPSPKPKGEKGEISKSGSPG
ncbi:MAG TPA: tetratricopeptide repeat protein [Chitinophagaceae bacterium]|nr:tetratricopeptide repeat protein [Chitinophagaceae bacterium]